MRRGEREKERKREKRRGARRNDCRVWRNVLFRICVFGVLFCILGGCNQKADSSEDNLPETGTKKESLQRGEQIVSEYLKRDFSPYRKSRARLTITPQQESPKVYVLEILRRQIENETRTLTRVIEPKDERDAASLTIEQKGKPTTNIAYVLSTDQFREAGTNKIFFGGLTAQELLGEWQKYDSRLLAEKERGGAKLFEVESALKPEADSIIKRFVTLFSANDYLPSEIRLFDGNNKELRVFHITETREIENRKIVWRTEIENHIYKTNIIIELLEMTFAEKIPDEFFEREYLKHIARK